MKKKNQSANYWFKTFFALWALFNFRYPKFKLHAISKKDITLFMIYFIYYIIHHSSVMFSQNIFMLHNLYNYSSKYFSTLYIDIIFLILKECEHNNIFNQYTLNALSEKSIYIKK